MSGIAAIKGAWAEAVALKERGELHEATLRFSRVNGEPEDNMSACRCSMQAWRFSGRMGCRITRS